MHTGELIPLKEPIKAKEILEEIEVSQDPHRDPEAPEVDDPLHIKPAAREKSPETKRRHPPTIRHGVTQGVEKAIRKNKGAAGLEHPMDLCQDGIDLLNIGQHLCSKSDITATTSERKGTTITVAISVYRLMQREVPVIRGIFKSNVLVYIGRERLPVRLRSRPDI